MNQNILIILMFKVKISLKQGDIDLIKQLNISHLYKLENRRKLKVSKVEWVSTTKLEDKAIHNYKIKL